MSEILPTVTIETANGPVRINESDFDAETMKLYEPAETPVTPPVVETQTTVAIPETPVIEPVKKFVTKKGKGFIVVDASGNQLDATLYDTEESAWASTLQV